MYRKKLQVETAGLGESAVDLMGYLSPEAGALSQASKHKNKVEAGIGGYGGSLAGAGAGAAAGALTGPLAPIAVPALSMAGRKMGGDIGGDILGGGKDPALAASDNFEKPDICEEFLNQHSSSHEAFQEIASFGKKKVLPSGVDGSGEGKLVTSTACNAGKV
jgi:phage tail tape-measure protein